LRKIYLVSNTKTADESVVNLSVSKIELTNFVKSELGEINSTQNELKSNFKFIKFKV